MGGLIPLGDASRRPARVPVVTILIILANAFVFVRELLGGEAFVTQWSAIPAQIFSGHNWITILTAMFMHASWSHIIGNMIFLWAFGPEIEDAMNPWRYAAFYLIGGVASMLDKLPAQLVGQIDPSKLQDERQFKRVVGIINSMTPQERRRPELLKASRKRRIAAGAGVPVQAVNQLLNQFEQMQKMMKMMKGGNMQRMMRGMKGMLPGMR